MAFFLSCPASSCFRFDGQLDEHTDGVAVIADFLTGDSKEKALNQATHKTLLLLLHGRHLCDWAHGPEELREVSAKATTWIKSGLIRTLRLFSP